VFYVFLLIIAALGACGYVALFLSHVPGAKEERFGRLEPLPDDLGNWKTLNAGPDAEAALGQGLLREERFLAHERDRKRLIKQVRYRDLTTNAIVRIDPEQIFVRERLSWGDIKARREKGLG
jgi:hypothetical protein